jgi:hypothetical protein
MSALFGPSDGRKPRIKMSRLHVMPHFVKPARSSLLAYEILCLDSSSVRFGLVGAVGIERTSY